jgi:hypothetical protein
MKYTFVKNTIEGTIYAALEGEVETETIIIEAESMQEAFAIADPDYIKRQEEQLAKLKAAYEAAQNNGGI